CVCLSTVGKRTLSPASFTFHVSRFTSLLLPSYSDGAFWSAAGAGVGAGALAVHRQAALVPDAPVALDLDQALDVHAHHAAQLALDRVFFVNGLAQLVDLFFGQVAHPGIWVHIGLLYDL